MKRMICLLLLTALALSCLPAAAPAEEELKEVRCEERHFSIRVPAGLNVLPGSFEDWYTDAPVCSGLVLSPGGEGELPEIRVMRRGRFYDIASYLSGYFPDYMEECGDNETKDCEIYTIGGRVLYGSTGTVYGDEGEELFRELRLIPAGDARGTEFAARYTAETEAEALAALDTVIRYYRPDEEERTAGFLPIGYADEQDLQNGTFLLRAVDADKIETDGYFTAVLYKPDYYSAGDVRAMRPGDTVLVMDRVLTITGIEPNGTEDDGSWYEADLYAMDPSAAGENFCFTLTRTEDGTAYWPYYGNDNHTASRVGEVRIRVPQPEPVEYVSEEEPDDFLLSDDLLGNLGDNPALFGIGWNEYTHSCTFTDGRLTRVTTWSYPYNPEDLFMTW